MKSIAIIDTSIFCNLVPVPNMDNDRQTVLQELENLIKDNTALLLPMAAILETGNHIGQNGNGSQRRIAAQKFSQMVTQAIEGEAPWTPVPFWENTDLLDWLKVFPDSAMRSVGLGDLSMSKLWEQQCILHAARRVFVWTLDAHLKKCDTGPRS